MKIFFPVLSAVMVFGAGPVRAVETVSHQAVYDITLASTRGGAAGVVNASGTMSYSARRVCGKWKTESVFSLDVGYEMAGNDTTVWRQTTTESDDGCFFEFDVFIREKGKDRKELAGKAVCENNKKVLYLTDPVRSKAVFPSSVVFPAAQTLRLLNAAEKGEKNVSTYLYDGTRPEALYSTNAVISVPENDRGTEVVNGDVSLIAGKRKYRFDMAFYKAFGNGESRDGSPYYEASVDYFENGISPLIEQDFGAYRLKSRLISLKRLTEEPCLSKRSSNL